MGVTVEFVPVLGSLTNKTEGKDTRRGVRDNRVGRTLHIVGNTIYFLLSHLTSSSCMTACRNTKQAAGPNEEKKTEWRVWYYTVLIFLQIPFQYKYPFTFLSRGKFLWH